ncbi:MAG TPA: maleylpyruvate isomerase N-terminal domain-containing protein [Anaerolineales bacterium]|nr:maleylpyruvate isomerase N-terminal domain-containing protein [Anaerolineales bacterium]
MNPFDPQMLAADLLEVKRIYAAFFAARSQADWSRHTEPHARGWTLRETVAHLDSVGQAYLQAAEATLAGQPCHIPGMLQRTELPAWNQREIEARAPRSIADICNSFLGTLQQASNSVARLSSGILSQTTHFPFYHRPISLGELFGGEAAHPGLVHAAQVARGAGVAPLWVQYPPALLHRQLTRFFHLMALSYWPERGGKLQAAIRLSAAGPGGGSWTVTLAPTGGQVAEGTRQPPRLRIWFRNADSLCRAMTFQLSPLRAVLSAQAFAWGDLRLAFQMGWLFNPA